ncbi:hypothetical protein CKO38_01525 [Rhodospirillum rubrum]|uniref:hypothetical protein n=1 Tax=Rhodospirillum rubrum TaxID=1085 RepID=UPI001905B207|nr:hypothetical protein [Rhodospirillum rubrum]MBK1663441.1 hypothetical protein [Rhodospirillum rubrum]MBK1675376.1 hypothetical protein [Rhodospirillum rubrum]
MGAPMTKTEMGQKAKGKWRIALFTLWIASTLLVFAAIALGAFVNTQNTGNEIYWWAPVVPTLMIVMLVSGGAWIAVLARSRRKGEQLRHFGAEDRAARDGYERTENTRQRPLS